MYAPKCARLLFLYNKTSYLLSRQFVSNKTLIPIKSTTVIDSQSNFLSVKNDNNFGCFFSTSNSPDSNHNVSAEKVKKRRRRIISDSSSDGANDSKDDIEK